MPVDYRDPESWKEHYEAACEMYREDLITYAVFSAMLYSLGFRGREIDYEITHQDDLRINSEEEMK